MSDNTDALRLAVVVGGAALILLFAGQVLQFAARWAGRAISGAFFLVLAAGIGYATYQLVSGWTAGEDTSNSASEAELSDLMSDSGVADRAGDSESQDGTEPDEEFQDELDDLLNSDQSQTDDITETN